jgi:HAMP domain-containing protein
MELRKRERDLETAHDGNTRLTAELEAALDEIGGLRAALRQMTRQQNAVS